MTGAAGRATLALLVASLLALAAAPLLMPADYSLLTHSVSESAAQGLDGAWLARFGLGLFGLAVITLASRAPLAWTPWALTAHTAFGVFMVATAIFSHAPWDGSPSDGIEDLVHSVASFGVGLSFTIGVVLVLKTRVGTRRSAFDWFALVAAMAIPLLMPRIDTPGLAQRIMFLTAMAWYARETTDGAGSERFSRSG